MRTAEFESTDRPIYTIYNTPQPSIVDSEGRILIIADSGVAYQGLHLAARRYFHNYDVTLCTALPDLDEDAGDIRIALIQATHCRDLTRIVGLCHERFGDAPVGIMVAEDWNSIPELQELVSGRQVQGLLPLNMKMNVWLAAVWLLLSGGEYFAYAQPREAYTANGLQKLSGQIGQGGNHNRSSSVQLLLSKRENEVLELVSEGLQNKIIANKMTLSEHTVKVHVHNIIRKLKVHNRTQAAAALRDGSQTGAMSRTSDHL